MSEVVGYVTLEEANVYVANHFLSSNVSRAAWESLSDADKMVLLRNSYRAIEMLTFSGRKTSSAQSSAFPRWPSTDVPAQIKDAQIANAIVLADESSQEDIEHYEKLRTYGVKSYKIGNLSETLGSTDEGSSASSYRGIYSQESMRLLSPWLGGGFKIV
jgi:hypothetical protein